MSSRSSYLSMPLGNELSAGVLFQPEQTRDKWREQQQLLRDRLSEELARLEREFATRGRHLRTQMR